MKLFLNKLYNKSLRKIKPLIKHLLKQEVLIHTPKCGGTYIVKQYNLNNHRRINNVGHKPVKSLNLNSKTKVTGLIREPADWYQSYYFFCKKALSLAPQSDDNFPVNHPISVFSKNATVGFTDMIKNMYDKNFIRNAIKTFEYAKIYSEQILDVFEFLERTNSGFWTWTMLYHFSYKDTKEFQTKEDVISEANKIKQKFNFIHQENIDADVERFLKIPHKPGEKINVSPRKKESAKSEYMKDIIYSLDGKIASIIGGY